ncbi:hypothetical protein PTI98_009738 [Pleurotus ostreatus]|nr:hypothetical protein PTI98_009738 [Pleurotus ostreatus]
MPSFQVCRQFAATGTCTYGGSCKFQHVRGSVAPNSAILSSTGRRKKHKKRRSKTTQFTVFFDDYPGFDYDPGNSAILEFYRLCDFCGWDREDPDRKEAHQAFKDALVQEFNDIYGTDENDIDSWHKICTVLDIDPLPDTLQEARDEVLSKHINIVDLVDNPGGHVTSFESLEDLREYTVDEGKYFPAENAYAGGLLKYLLREIHGTYKGNRRPSDFGSRRRRFR